MEKDRWREERIEGDRAVHGRKCSFCDLMILKITYEGINMGARALFDVNSSLT